MNKSVWSDSIETPKFKKLNEDINTDVLIIGGGMCGILCGHILGQKGIDYVIAEGDKIGGGITKNTSAKITSQHGFIYSKLIKSMGIERAKMYLNANEKAILDFESICKNIDCNFEKKSAFTYSLVSRVEVEQEVKAVNSLGFKAKLKDDLSLPFKTKGAVEFENQAQFNPLKFIAGISKDLNIYENTFVREIRDNIAYCDNGKIKAKKIIVATHFPFINKHGLYFIKMYQHRSYVIAIEGAPKIEGMYVDERQDGMSFRQYNDLLLIGGGDHRTGKQGGNFKELIDFKEKYYGDLPIKYSWATQDCMSLDGIAYIGQYARNTPDLLVATGFNKWGMTSSMVSANILSDMAMGKENRLSRVFSPQRSILKPQLFANAFEATVNLLTPSRRRCPHLGCALKWNKTEHTWDCPCHGSRFEKEGKLIDNPSTGDANI